MKKNQRIGILTSGGDAPGLNAVIRAVTRTAIADYGMTVFGFEQGYRGLIENKYRQLDHDSLSGILTLGGTILGTSREKPFKDTGWKDDTGTSAVDLIKQNYYNLNLDCLVVLGGNGTNTTGYLLSEEGLNVVGVPKTIDNDIAGTDETIGFDTALDIATEAIDRLHSTATSHNRVMVIEIMGHKAGWLALYSGLAAGGDVILLPEIPYDKEVVAAHLRKRTESGRSFSIVVVAEGALAKDEVSLSKSEFKKARAELGKSIGYRVADEIAELTELETRVTVLGYVQRGGVPSSRDRVLATLIGSAAAKMIYQQDYGKLVAIVNNKPIGVPLAHVANKTKLVPVDHPLILTAAGIGTCLGI